MKKFLSTSVLSILLVSLASGVYGQTTIEYIEYPNGQRYVGEYRDGRPNGQGTLAFNGHRYVGEFRDGERSGQGTLTYASGDVYVGEFRDGQANGQGTYTWANGQVYVGEYRDGERSGQGTYTWANGNVYVGEHLNNLFNGQGTMTYSDGSTRTGIWDKSTYIGTQAQFDQSEREREARVEREIVTREAREERERVAREEAMKKHERIYNACLLDKSQSIDMQVSSLREAVEGTCEAIADEPSWWEEFKYN